MFNSSGKKREWLIKEVTLLGQKGISKAEIARRLDILPQQLNNILNGSRGVSDSFLDNFIEAFELNQIDLYSSLLPDPDADSIYKRILEIFSEEKITPRKFQENNKQYSHLFDNALHWNDPKTAKSWVDLVASIYPKYSSKWLISGTGDKYSSHSPNICNIVAGGSQTGNIDNRHYYSDSPDVLRSRIDSLEKELKDKLSLYDERIKEKDAQIKEKDAQIKQLLDILQKK